MLAHLGCYIQRTFGVGEVAARRACRNRLYGLPALVIGVPSVVNAICGCAIGLSGLNPFHAQ